MLSFAEPVRDAQQTFRAVMMAMANPGRLMTVAPPESVPAGLEPAAAALLLTLLDFETTLWLPPSRPLAVREYVQFHTGTRWASTLATAAFVLVDLKSEPLDLSYFAQGDPAYPDRSTTIIAEVTSLVFGERMRLTGPGIEHEAKIAAKPMPQGFLAMWAANTARFPLGVDLVLVSGDQLLALPRTVRIDGGS